jgi:hypothetical protein
MTNVETQTIDVDAILEKAEHFVCCHDVTKTFCGLTIDDDFNGWVETVECAACMAIVTGLDENNVFCPIGTYCAHVIGDCDCPLDED